MQIDLKKYLQEISDEIYHLQKKLKRYPAGTLFCTRNGTHVKWYISNLSSPVYIRKSQRSLAVALAEKKFYENRLHLLSLQRDCLLQYEKKSQKYKAALETMIQPDSPYRELISENILEIPRDESLWMQEEYPRNLTYPENLVHKTYAGDWVRSKSETMIANALFQNKIAYRYENQLDLDEASFFPDFTILHPKTKKVYYWEHLGLMDNPSYVEKSFHKLKVYAKHEIIPSVNLILTYETKAHPFHMEAVEKVVADFFL